LGLGSGLDKDVIKIQDFGGPSVHKGKTGLLPSGVEPESTQTFFEFRGSKEGSGWFAISVNHAGVDGSGIAGNRMETYKNESVRSGYSVFEDTESIALLFGKEGDIRRSGSSVWKVEDLLNILATSSAEKMTLPGVPISVFLEGFEIRNVASNTFAKGINSRGCRSRSRGRQTWRKELDAMGLEIRESEIKPTGNARRRLSAEPRVKRSKLLDLDGVELLIRSAVLDEGEDNATVGRGIHGDKIGCVCHTGNSEACTERSKSRVSCSRSGLKKEDRKDMLKSIDIRSSDRSHDQ
jgi:hypothetical protein